MSGTIPDVIRGTPTAVVRPPERYWGFDWLARKVGETIRDTLFLPLQGLIPTYLQDTHKEVTNRRAALQNSRIQTTKKCQLIRKHFRMRDVQVEISDPTDSCTRAFTVRLFETKKPIRGKKLRLFLFSFYGNKQTQEQKNVSWDPQTITQLSRGPLDVLGALHRQGIKVDTVMTSSLGNIMWEGLESFLSDFKDRSIIPQTILIDRGFTSVEKVGKKLYSCLPRTILSTLTRWSKWSADPERALCTFIEESKRQEKRKIHIYKAQEDHFFSGPGDFDANLHTTLSRGAEVVQASFLPLDLHPTAHHGAPLNMLKFNSTTKIVTNPKTPFKEDHQKLTTMIARNILLNDSKKQHTLFVVGGNKGTLDMMVEEIATRILPEYIKEALKPCVKKPFFSQ